MTWMDTTPTKWLNVADILFGSYVSGPGRRNVLFLQGCSIRCPGCSNKPLWEKTEKSLPVTGETVRLLLDEAPSGVTISGGEPFDQLDSVVELVRQLREKRDHASIIIYTGHDKAFVTETIARLTEAGTPMLADVILCGPYLQEQRVTDDEREGGYLPVGSRNQEAIRLTGRIRKSSLVTSKTLEARVDPDGSLVMTGFPGEDWRMDL